MIESDKTKVLGVLKELSGSMTRAEAERDFQKEAIKDASEKYEIDKKKLRRLAKTYHKQNLNEEQGENDEFFQLAETILG